MACYSTGLRVVAGWCILLCFWVFRFLVVLRDLLRFCGLVLVCFVFLDLRWFVVYLGLRVFWFLICVFLFLFADACVLVL